MTGIDARRPDVDGGRRADPEARAKSVLFCPVCGHEGTPADDWVVRAAESGDEAPAAPGTHEYVCPECETVVTVR